MRIGRTELKSLYAESITNIQRAEGVYRWRQRLSPVILAMDNTRLGRGESAHQSQTVVSRTRLRPSSGYVRRRVHLGG